MKNPVIGQIKNVKQSTQSLPELVAEQINQLIIDRQLKKGDKLPTEVELMQQLNVSRGSVREAVKLLVARNVLVIQRGVGTFIADDTGIVEDPFGFAYMEDEERLVWELMVLREHLEPWTAGLAAKLATQEDIDELRNWQRKVEDDIHSGVDHVADDQGFHTCIAKCTQNRVLPMLIPVITYSIQLFVTLTQGALAEETIETHARIVDAIEAHDSERASAEMLEHLRFNRSLLASVITDEKKATG